MMTGNALPQIPLIRAPHGGDGAIAGLSDQPHRMAALIASAQRQYTRPGMEAADYLSRRWAGRLASPYADNVRAVSAALGRSGAWLLNYSYEWGCTAGAAPDAELGGMTLLRTLDWPFDGLGRNLVAVMTDGGAGAYLTVGWPGYVGVLTALAPGRFAASVNQPPLPATFWGKATGWPLARLRVARSRAMPADHLLRLAFDTCRSFAEAERLLRSTPICLPATFTLVGPERGEAIVIERTPQAAFIAEEPAAANHWAAPGAPAGRPRDATSRERRMEMCGLIRKRPDWSFGWLTAPILQPSTRLAFMANPATGRYALQGFERDGAATAILAA